jgi:hypothetical protein
VLAADFDWAWQRAPSQALEVIPVAEFLTVRMLIGIINRLKPGFVSDIPAIINLFDEDRAGRDKIEAEAFCVTRTSSDGTLAGTRLGASGRTEEVDRPSVLEALLHGYFSWKTGPWHKPIPCSISLPKKKVFHLIIRPDARNNGILFRHQPTNGE